MIDFRRLFLNAGMLSLLVVYPMLWMRMILDPAQRSGSDFIAFFAAGRVAQSAGLASVYDPLLQQQVQEQVVGFELAPGQVLLYNHVPFLLPLLLGLVSGNYVASFLRWVGLLAALFLAGVLLLARLLSREQWPAAQVRTAAGGMLVFFPFFISLMNGQDTAFTTLGVCLLVYGLLTGQDRIAGLGLALTTVRPQLALFLALPFLFRQRRIFAWFCLGAAALGLVSFLLLGPSGSADFIELLRISAAGEWYGLKEPLMINFIGLLWRVVPALGAQAIRWSGWGLYGLALAGMCLAWHRNPRIDARRVGLLITAAVFCSPHLHYHDLSLLVVPLFLLLRELVRGGFLTAAQASPLPAAVAVLLLASAFLPVLQTNLPYLLMLGLAVLLGLPGLHARLWRPPGGEAV